MSTLNIFLAAMTLYPDVQKRAQEELETMVGLDRLPTIADKDDLPYVSAVAKECLRWRSVVPLSIPHLCSEEDEFRGYRIPKGSIVLSNTWYVKHSCRFPRLWLIICCRAYARDERYYPDPETFKPERFLLDGVPSPKVRDPQKHVFGFGRRYASPELSRDSAS